LANGRTATVVRQRQHPHPSLPRRRGRVREGAFRSDAEGADGPRDVLELLLADVFEGEVEPACRILLHPRRYADPAGLGQAFEPGCDVDAIAKDVAVLDDDVADIDPDAPLYAPLGRNRVVALGHARLHLDRAAQRVDDARELDEKAVSAGLYDPAAVLGDLRINQIRADPLEPRECTLLVGANQARVAGHVRREDGGEPALRSGLLHGALPSRL
jgi:hypothetical protein